MIFRDICNLMFFYVLFHGLVPKSEVQNDTQHGSTVNVSTLKFRPALTFTKSLSPTHSLIHHTQWCKMNQDVADENLDGGNSNVFGIFIPTWRRLPI